VKKEKNQSTIAPGLAGELFIAKINSVRCPQNSANEEESKADLTPYL
jgi:hypothetical protein